MTTYDLIVLGVAAACFLVALCAACVASIRHYLELRKQWDEGKEEDEFK